MYCFNGRVTVCVPLQAGSVFTVMTIEWPMQRKMQSVPQSDRSVQMQLAAGLPAAGLQRGQGGEQASAAAAQTPQRG
jgi:hypothetical protein